MAASAVAAGPTYGVVVLCRRVIDKKTIAELGLAWRPTQLVAGFVAGGLMVLGISGGLWASGALHVSGLATADESGGVVGAKLLGFLFLVFLQSGAEELVCRGYLLRTLMGLWRPWVSVAVVSLFFAALHLMNAGTSLASFVSTALIGVLFAQICLRTGNLWAAIGLHTAWNFTLGAIASLPVSGSTTFHLFAVEDLGPAWLTGGSYGLEASVVTIALVAIACGVMAMLGRGRTPLSGH
jgi:membrane protease YdiL (CAAX protease family)